MDVSNEGTATLPLLVIRNRVLFPGGLLRLSVGKPRSARLIEELLVGDKRFDAPLRSFLQPGRQTPLGPLIAVFALKPGVQEEDERDPPIFAVGCVGRVVQVSRATTQDSFQFSVLVQGVSRVRLEGLVQHEPYYMAAVARVDDVGKLTDPKVRALAISVREAVQELTKALRTRISTPRTHSHTDAHGGNGRRNGPDVPSIRQVTEAIHTAPVTTLADEVVAHLNVPLEEKQSVLEEARLEDRLMKALELIKGQIEVLSISSKISSKVESKLSSRQREYFLRQQLKAIREELGEDDDSAEEDDVAELKSRIKKAELPDDVRAAADKELRRLKRMQASQPEYTVVRNYLDWLVDLPWSVRDEDSFDVGAVEAQLNKDHYGLAKVKRRIVEYIAVRSLKRSLKGPILCLVGPPGVGKTSLGKSIAQALGRRFHRLSLGGVHDEAEIRGHRRTYIGAMPGNILQSISKAGSRNPVLLLDEIDKLGVSVRGGDPAAALLEVLDPEQNHSFTDHYLNLPFDLSSVFFVATANQTDTIPEPLLDRMEVIQLPGYTIDEKVHIAQQYLVPKQLDANGLVNHEHLAITPGAVHRIATGYTQEAGVRQIERELAAVCRYVAVKLARERGGAIGPANGGDNDNDSEPAASASSASETPDNGPGFSRVVVTENTLIDILGPVKYESETAARTSVPGVATGMAWKPSGGELLFIECSTVHNGRGALTITGKLGEVMRESAIIATTWLRSRSAEVRSAVGPIGAEIGANTDVHIHVPAGAIPKDGPSAGVAIVVALVSLVTGRRVRSSVAMTGEITLRGLVLPVGGIKEKVLAAHRGGITHVVLPYRNAKDLSDLPPNVRKDLKFTLATTITEVLEVVFEPLAAGSDEALSVHPHMQRPPHTHAHVHVKDEDDANAQQPPTVVHKGGAGAWEEKQDQPPVAARGAHTHTHAHADAHTHTQRDVAVDLCGPVLRSLL